MRDCYGQWDTAELIVRFHRQHYRLPASWEDIREAYGDDSELRGGLSVAQLQQIIVVEFARLGELEALAKRTLAATSLPEIIQPSSGRQSHWAGAEPNTLVYEYFCKNPEK
ncbi:MAG: hypothetical protein AAB263_20885 [Planctomycetota bacterium]